MYMKSGIYKIYCINNGCYYYGSSINLKERWIHHRKRLRNKTHGNIRLQRVWNKYGEKSIVFEIVNIVPEKEIRTEEQKYLDAHYGKKKCLNMNPHSSGGIVFTCKVKQIYNGNVIAEFNSIKEASKKTGTNQVGISYACNGKQASAGGFEWEYSSRKTAIKKQKRITGSWSCKPIIQFDIENNQLKIWDSCSQAGKTLGIAISNLVACLKGRQKTAGNFIWKYLS
jgi:group I intron endonuclease